jgi:hypothetical protein
VRRSPAGPAAEDTRRQNPGDAAFPAQNRVDPFLQYQLAGNQTVAGRRAGVPQITIKTGFADKNGKEEVLTEYFCDWPDCVNVAVEVLGFSRDIGVFAAVCEEHAASIKSDREPPRKQQ